MGEEVYTCRHCKKLFTSSVKRKICEECAKKEDELFVRIKDYLRKYPNSNAMQIAEGLDINVMSVLYFIDEGRLSMVDVKLFRLEETEKRRSSQRQESIHSRQSRSDGVRSQTDGSGRHDTWVSEEIPDISALMGEGGKE